MKARIDDGEDIKNFEVVDFIKKSAKNKYLFTACGEDGGYYKCFYNT